MDLQNLNLKLSSLVIFRGLHDDGVLKRLPPLLSSGDGIGLLDGIKSYADFVSRLFRENENFTDYLWDRLSSDENIYVLKTARKEPVGPALENCLINELLILEELSRLDAKEVKAALGYDGWLPSWETGELDFTAAYRERLRNISTRGYGIYSKSLMFCISGGGVAPVKSPDPITLSELKGYDGERELVVGNTLALLNGKPAANALLYGDAGTGKSSTVKAIVNEFGDKGLRLIEIRKNQLLELPAIIDELGANPLKFILFIDDLSFAQNNEDIGALKAILEGSASAKSPNAVIYATSNRRHIVSERFSDRNGDDVHRNETIEEQTSLSERFGLTVGFFRPDKEKYLSIVSRLAEHYGIGLEVGELVSGAERFALSRGRSPRTARQFIESLRSIAD